MQKVEGRVASDQELKLTELLRYYMRDIQAAKVRPLHFFTNHSSVVYLCTSHLNWRRTEFTVISFEA